MAVRHIIGTCQARLHLAYLPTLAAPLKSPLKSPLAACVRRLCSVDGKPSASNRLVEVGGLVGGGDPFPMDNLAALLSRSSSSCGSSECALLYVSRRVEAVSWITDREIKTSHQFGSNGAPHRASAVTHARSLERSYPGSPCLPRPASIIKRARRGGRETALLKGPEERFVDRERPPRPR